MEAHISHQRLDAMFRNIRFVDNALARRKVEYYVLVAEAFGEEPSRPFQVGQQVY